jgi:YD repeat-containing protein
VSEGDTLGRLAKVIDSTGNTAEQYAYTANGKLASLTDARGNATAHTYDGFDRLSLITYPSYGASYGVTVTGVTVTVHSRPRGAPAGWLA